MNQYKYSAEQNVRYLIEMLPYYSDQSLLPKDLVDISDDMSAEFFDETPPEGKMRAAGDNGLPCWVDIPPPSKESLIELAENQRSIMRKKADSEIAWRQDAVDIEIATDEEAAALAAWKKFRVLLMRTDTSTAPDVKWPKQPGS